MKTENSSNMKLKRVFKIPLMIISVVIIALIVFSGFVYFNDGDSKKIYGKIIERFENNLYEYLDNGTNANKLEGNIGFNIKNSGALLKEEQSMMDILNALSIAYETEIDNELNKANFSVKAKYEQENILEFALNNVNNETFINLGSLYDKKIKVKEENIKFTYLSVEKQKKLINEIINIINVNLKEEYFYKEKETLKINDKNVYTTKHTLEMNSTEIYDFKIKIIDDIKNCNELLEFMAEYRNVDKSQLINGLNSYRNELLPNSDEHFKIDLYFNLISKKIEKVVVSDKKDKISFIRTSKTEYDITYTENTFTNLVGHLTLSGDEIKLNYNNKKVGEITCSLSTDELILNIKDDSYKINVNITNKDVTSYIFETIIIDEGLEMKFFMNGTAKSIDKVSDKIITNYIKEDDVTDEDIGIIYSNLMKNETLICLIEDITYIYSRILENGYTNYEGNFQNNLDTPTF